MLRFSNTYINRPILSLRTGNRIGTILTAVINPNNLKIEGWHAKSLHDRGEFILLSLEIRELIPKGLVVNDFDALTQPEDLIRLREVIDTDLQLIDMQVRTESGKKLGKISDYTIDDKSYFIQKLYVQPTIFYGLNAEQFIIDRTAIVEISDDSITVRDTTERVGSRVPAVAGA